MLILMSICLLASPQTCREERIPCSFAGASATACIVRSQEAIAEWQAGHPLWRVARWRCVSRDRVPTHI